MPSAAETPQPFVSTPREADPQTKEHITTIEVSTPSQVPTPENGSSSDAWWSHDLPALQLEQDETMDYLNMAPAPGESSAFQFFAS